MKIFPGRSPWSLWLIVLMVLLVAAPARAQTAAQLYARGVQAYEQGEIPLAKLRLQQTLKVDQNFPARDRAPGQDRAGAAAATAGATGLARHP